MIASSSQGVIQDQWLIWGNLVFFFSKHMNRDSCEEVTRKLQMRELDLNEKYLVTNFIIPRSRDNCLDPSINKI